MAWAVMFVASVCAAAADTATLELPRLETAAVLAAEAVIWTAEDAFVLGSMAITLPFRVCSCVTSACTSVEEAVGEALSCWSVCCTRASACA